MGLTIQTIVWSLDLSFFAVVWDVGTMAFSLQSIKMDRRIIENLHRLRVRKRMVREGRRNGKKCPWSDILGGSSLTSVVATSLPSQSGLRLPAFVQEGPEGRWSLHPLWHLYPRFDPCDWAAMWPSRARGRLLSIESPFCKSIRIKDLSVNNNLKMPIGKDLMRVHHNEIDKEMLFLWYTTFFLTFYLILGYSQLTMLW